MGDETIDSLKGLPRDPLGDIRLEDLLGGTSVSIAEQLTDERFQARTDDLSATGFDPV